MFWNINFNVCITQVTWSLITSTFLSFTQSRDTQASVLYAHLKIFKIFPSTKLNFLDFHSRNLFYSFSIIIWAYSHDFINRLFFQFIFCFHFNSALFWKHDIIHLLNEKVLVFFPFFSFLMRKYNFLPRFHLFIIHKILFIISHFNFMFVIPTPNMFSSLLFHNHPVTLHYFLKSLFGLCRKRKIGRSLSACFVSFCRSLSSHS